MLIEASKVDTSSQFDNTYKKDFVDSVKDFNEKSSNCLIIEWITKLNLTEMENIFTLRCTKIVQLILKMIYLTKFQIYNTFSIKGKKLDFRNDYLSDSQLVCSKIAQISKDSKEYETFIINELRVTTVDSVMDTITTSDYFISKLEYFLKGLNEISNGNSFKSFNFIEECEANCFSLPKWFEPYKPNSVGTWIYAIFESLLVHKYMFLQSKSLTINFRKQFCQFSKKEPEFLDNQHLINSLHSKLINRVNFWNDLQYKERVCFLEEMVGSEVKIESTKFMSKIKQSFKLKKELTRKEEKKEIEKDILLSKFMIYLVGKHSKNSLELFSFLTFLPINISVNRFYDISINFLHFIDQAIIIEKANQIPISISKAIYSKKIIKEHFNNDYLFESKNRATFNEIYDKSILWKEISSYLKFNNDCLISLKEINEIMKINRGNSDCQELNEKTHRKRVESFPMDSESKLISTPFTALSDEENNDSSTEELKFNDGLNLKDNGEKISIFENQNQLGTLLEKELQENALLNFRFMGNMLLEKCQEDSSSSPLPLKIPTKIQNLNKSPLNFKQCAKNSHNTNSKKNKSRKKKQAKLLALQNSEIIKKSNLNTLQEEINTSPNLSNKIEPIQLSNNPSLNENENNSKMLSKENQIIKDLNKENSQINATNEAQNEQAKINPDQSRVKELSDISEKTINISKEMIDFFTQLNEEIINLKLENEKFLDKFEPYKKFIIDHLRQIIGLEFPQSKIDLIIYGSHSTGLALESSDIDLAIVGLSSKSKEDIIISMDKISERMKGSEIILDIKNLREAKIPIISININLLKIADFIKEDFSQLGKKSTTIKIDISFENLTTMQDEVKVYPVKVAINCSKFIKWMISKHKNLKEILLIIKKLFYVNKLNIPFFGGLCSYGQTLIAASFINSFKSAYSFISQQLFDLIFYYGFNFDNKYFGIGFGFKCNICFIQILDPLEDEIEELIILDPLNPINNVAKSCYQFQNIKKMFRNTYNILSGYIHNKSTNILNGLLS